MNLVEGSIVQGTVLSSTMASSPSLTELPQTAFGRAHMPRHIPRKSFGDVNSESPWNGGERIINGHAEAMASSQEEQLLGLGCLPTPFIPALSSTSVSSTPVNSPRIASRPFN